MGHMNFRLCTIKNKQKFLVSETFVYLCRTKHNVPKQKTYTNMETNALGKEIAKTRKAKRMTQEQLGKLVGLPKSSISKMENGKTKLTWEDASILMEAMGETLTLPSEQPKETEEAKEQRLRMLISGVEWLASEKNLPLNHIYRFLLMYKGFDFLSENYRYEQTLPKGVIINDLLAVCERNGGRI